MKVGSQGLVEALCAGIPIRSQHRFKRLARPASQARAGRPHPKGSVLMERCVTEGWIVPPLVQPYSQPRPCFAILPRCSPGSTCSLIFAAYLYPYPRHDAPLHRPPLKQNVSILFSCLDPDGYADRRNFYKVEKRQRMGGAADEGVVRSPRRLEHSLDGPALERVGVTADGLGLGVSGHTVYGADEATFFAESNSRVIQVGYLYLFRIRNDRTELFEW